MNKKTAHANFDAVDKSTANDLKKITSFEYVKAGKPNQCIATITTQPAQKNNDRFSFIAGRLLDLNILLLSRDICSNYRFSISKLANNN